MDPHSLNPFFARVCASLNQGLLKLCQETGSLYLSGLYLAAADPDDDFALSPSITIDGAHFNHEGYKLLGETIARLLVEQLGEGDVVLLLGDSITAGYPHYEPVLMGEHRGDESHSFGHYIRTILGCRVVNRGISGDTTDNMVGRLKDYLAGTPKMVVLQGGANDAFNGASFGPGGLSEERAEKVTGVILENFREMVTLCLEKECQVAVVPLLPFGVF